MQTIRTTVQFDPRLFQEAKLLAVREGLTFKKLVTRGLEAVVRGQVPVKQNKSKSKVRFGGYDLGGIKSKISRAEIYEDL